MTRTTAFLAIVALAAALGACGDADVPAAPEQPVLTPADSCHWAGAPTTDLARCRKCHTDVRGFYAE
jgi:hypothetical protein